MGLTLALNENDLRIMPSDLRESLLRWYFDRQLTAPVEHQPAAEPAIQPEQYESHDNGSRRVTFGELVRGGFLKRRAEIWCRSLKRQKRAGAEDFIKGAKVADNGAVVYQDRKFSNPSKLAVAMVNANGGNTEALNGYAYLFVHSDTRLIPLEALRKQMLEGTPAEQAVVDELLESDRGKGAFGTDRAEALEYVRQNPLPGRAKRDK